MEIHRPAYRKRKLKANALVLACFMMIEHEVEESTDEQIKKLFVEVYGDRDLFLADFLKELDKVDEIEADMLSRQPRMAHPMGPNAHDGAQDIGGELGFEEGRRAGLSD